MVRGEGCAFEKGWCGEMGLKLIALLSSKLLIYHNPHRSWLDLTEQQNLTLRKESGIVRKISLMVGMGIEINRNTIFKASKHSQSPPS